MSVHDEDCDIDLPYHSARKWCFETLPTKGLHTSWSWVSGPTMKNEYSELPLSELPPPTEISQPPGTSATDEKPWLPDSDTRMATDSRKWAPLGVLGPSAKQGQRCRKRMETGR